MGGQVIPVKMLQRVYLGLYSLLLGGWLWFMDIILRLPHVYAHPYFQWISFLIMAYALIALIRVRVNAAYTRAISYLLIAFVLVTCGAMLLHRELISRNRILVLLVIMLYSFNIFSVAMQWLCKHIGLGYPAYLWERTTTWFFRMYAVPIFLVSLYVLIHFVWSKEIFIYEEFVDLLSFFGLPLYFVFAVPFIMLGKAFVHTINELKARRVLGIRKAVSVQKGVEA